MVPTVVMDKKGQKKQKGGTVNTSESPDSPKSHTGGQSRQKMLGLKFVSSPTLGERVVSRYNVKVDSIVWAWDLVIGALF